MASFYSRPLEVEITISSAKDLKNVNWRHGDLKPYTVLWVDPNNNRKCSTKVDGYGDTCPTWDEALVIPLTAPINESTLLIDIVHANGADDVKPLIGSARLPLSDILNDVGLGDLTQRKLKLKRPSGRPQGKLELEIMVRDCRYHSPDPYHAPPYDVPQPSPTASRDYPSPGPYHHGSPYGPPPPPPPTYAYSGMAPPTAAYPYNPSPYGQSPYEQPAAYGEVYGEKKKESKYRMGTGLAVGAVAGMLGGLALAEGFDYVEDKIADDVAEKVEEDLGYDDEGGYGDDE
ncbi:C2 calcium-dependent membrane targeting [Macleaya cordata]|uniref:C2 calcium-dependent membrane targeting n=1 Tax=Macleaya cordata TaxID=56857 RepID=A0A200Q850_MACCD|nr:C2 calcium-dependent membrane targeting [Macleaya cordata]